MHAMFLYTTITHLYFDSTNIWIDVLCKEHNEAKFEKKIYLHHKNIAKFKNEEIGDMIWKINTSRIFGFQVIVTQFFRGKITVFSQLLFLLLPNLIKENRKLTAYINTSQKRSTYEVLNYNNKPSSSIIKLFRNFCN